MKITDNVYALDSTKGAYAYVIIDKEIIMVDTGLPGTGKKIVKELEAMNINLKDIKHIVFTHHDVDHIGNASMLQKLTGATLWASDKDIEYIRGNKKRPGVKSILSVVTRVNKVDNICAYDKDKRIGDIEVIPAPGHTPGHVCILYKDVLFAGDLARSRKGKLIPSPRMNYNKAELMKSFEKVSRLSFRWVCPAHGEPVERENQKKI